MMVLVTCVEETPLISTSLNYSGHNISKAVFYNRTLPGYTKHQLSCGDHHNKLYLVLTVIDSTCIKMSFSHRVWGIGVWLVVRKHTNYKFLYEFLTILFSSNNLVLFVVR